MGTLDNILREVDETYLVEHITKKHDEARIQYSLSSITVYNDIAFDDAIADYYNYHFTRCISSGGELSRAEAAGRAKEIIAKEYKRKGMDILNAYSDGKTGTNGGMRAILDMLMESLKEEAVERHIRDVFDRYIQPSSYEERVAIIKELLNKIGRHSPYVDYDHPERYAHNYEELIRALVEHIRNQSAIFRRL
jgi:predicted small metal-binding protein